MSVSEMKTKWEKYLKEMGQDETAFAATDSDKVAGYINLGKSRGERSVNLNL